MHLSSKHFGPASALAALLAVSVGGLLGQAAPSSSSSSSSSAGSAERSGPFAEFDRGDLRGLVTPGRRVRLGAPMGTQVKAVKVDEGDRVESGDLLAEFDYEMQELAVELNKLKIKEERMRLDESEIQLQKMTEGRETYAFRDWEIRKKELQRDAAKVALERAKQNQELEEVKLDRYFVRAPFDGYVHQIEVDKGSSLRQGDPVLSLVSLDPLEAELHLPVELYSRISVGQRYRLRAEQAIVPELEDPLIGRVKMVDPLIDSPSQTFRCVFEIPNPEHKLPAGFPVYLLGPVEPRSE